MTDENVTPVTRNNQYVEFQLLFDLLGWVGLMYFLTHPDMFDKIGEGSRRAWGRFVHRCSVWSARQDIRSLPETEE